MIVDPNQTINTSIRSVIKEQACEDMKDIFKAILGSVAIGVVIIILIA